MDRASASEAVCSFASDFQSGQTNDFKIDIHSFPGPAWRSALMEQFGEQAGKFSCYAIGKGT